MCLYGDGKDTSGFVAIQRKCHKCGKTQPPKMFHNRTVAAKSNAGTVAQTLPQAFPGRYGGIGGHNTASFAPNKPMKTTAHLSAQIFSHSSEERVALARERFFEEGERPSGLVPEAVIQSWGRMWTSRGRTTTKVAFNEVSTSRLHSVLARNQELLTAARSDIVGLEAVLSVTGCRVLLTDARGVIIHATPAPLAPNYLLLRQVARVGVNISEDSVGTNAPALAAKTGEAVVVSGPEHFYDCMQSLRCSAVPIRNARGQLAGVLDLSMENGPFPFDAAAMAGMSATSIENRLLQTQAQDHLVVHFQPNAGLLGTPLAGLMGICAQGQIAWFNGAGAALLGRPFHQPQSGTLPVEAVLGCTLHQLLAL